jgi:hypothetical protein
MRLMIMNMDVKSVSEFISQIAIPVTALLGIITTSFTLIITLLQFKLKSKVQTEMIKNKNIESQIKMIKLFSELMNIAHARGDTEISEKLVEHIVSKYGNIIDENERIKFKKIIGDTVYLTKPIGLAAQDAAIAAIYSLGIRYDFLYDSALQGLKTLNIFKENVTKEYIEKMERFKK